MVDENVSRVASYCRPPLITVPPQAHKNELQCQSRRQCTGLLSPVQLYANPHNSPLGPVMTWKSPKGMFIFHYTKNKKFKKIVNFQSLYNIGFGKSQK